MEDNSSSNLTPNEDEILEILTQLAQYPPSQIPVVLLQLHCARMLVQKIDQLREELAQEINKLTEKLNLQQANSK